MTDYAKWILSDPRHPLSVPRRKRRYILWENGGEFRGNVLIIIATIIDERHVEFSNAGIIRNDARMRA